MRLLAREGIAIKEAAADAFGPDAIVRLFGSRVHDHLRGGDIDLHFETSRLITRGEVDRFEDRLFASLDEQRVDKIFTRRGDALSPFEQIACRNGIIL